MNQGPIGLSAEGIVVGLDAHSFLGPLAFPDVADQERVARVLAIVVGVYFRFFVCALRDISQILKNRMRCD